jgi:predicted ATP-dependent endonuclease of OLD family
MVEGPAERMLVPYFIKHQTNLSSCYISILEIGGSHAHTLRSLIENLGIITVIITDIDSIDPADARKKKQPILSKNYETNNTTLNSWVPKIKELDQLLKLDATDKEHKSLPIRVCYQMPILFDKVQVNPYTFEDSLVMENREFFQKLDKGIGLLKKMMDAAKESDFEKSATEMYDSINAQGAKKAEFALELFYLEESKNLNCPKYIKEGLKWLEEKLSVRKDGLVPSESAKADGKLGSKKTVIKTKDAISATSVEALNLAVEKLDDKDDSLNK